MSIGVRGCCRPFSASFSYLLALLFFLLFFSFLSFPFLSFLFFSFLSLLSSLLRPPSSLLSPRLSSLVSLITEYSITSFSRYGVISVLLSLLLSSPRPLSLFFLPTHCHTSSQLPSFHPLTPVPIHRNPCIPAPPSACIWLLLVATTELLSC